MKIHFIGIGGIGVSGLANIYLEKGDRVQGSDMIASEITEELQAKGVNVLLGHRTENISSDIDLVVYSEAVSQDNAELTRAKELGIKSLSGAQCLAELAKDYFLIAVSGMHGKTTTASMIAHILNEVGFDPTYVIGAKNGSRLGKGKYLVIEADDYQAKLLNYQPDILVLTNIEEEHMDYFQDLEHILKVFEKYLGQVKKLVIANKADENIRKIIKAVKVELKYFDVSDIKLQVPGKHNQSNASAALEVALALGIDKEKALKALESFQPVWRRFEEKEIRIGERQMKIISDYAHHPTEIKATLEAARQKYPGKEIVCIFQLHQYQRTFYLFDKFVAVFKQSLAQHWLDKLIITDIYDVVGRENKEAKAKVSAQKLVDAIDSQAVYLPKEKIKDWVKSNAQNKGVVILMGAGPDVDLAFRACGGA